MLFGYGVGQQFFDGDQAKFCGWKVGWLSAEKGNFLHQKFQSGKTVTVVNSIRKLSRLQFRGNIQLKNHFSSCSRPTDKTVACRRGKISITFRSHDPE